MKRILLTILSTCLGITAGVGMAQNSTPSTESQKTPKSQPASIHPAPAKTAPSVKTPTVPVPAAAKEGVSAQQDKLIEATIRAKLAKSKIGKDGFTVRVQGGVAYWEGGTSVVQHKGSATRMAKSAGAHAVVNNIQVADAAKQKAADNLDQGRRRAQVKRSDTRTQK